MSVAVLGVVLLMLAMGNRAKPLYQKILWGLGVSDLLIAVLLRLHNWTLASTFMALGGLGIALASAMSVFARRQLPR